jgi:hypothetical protein
VGDKPFELVRVDDLARHLRTTMARAGDVFAASMRSQLSHIVSWFLRMRLAGAAYIHPGMAKMARWGQCSERQARENFSRLRQWDVVEVVAYPKRWTPRLAVCGPFQCHQDASRGDGGESVDRSLRQISERRKPGTEAGVRRCQKPGSASGFYFRRYTG